MKCIKYKDQILRVSDKCAQLLVDKGAAEYVSKELWKENGRNYDTVSKSQLRRLQYMEGDK
jgi:hypothetical protein